MKIFIIFLSLLPVWLYSQTFLGVSYKNGDPSNSTSIELIQRITFSGSTVTFLLTNATSINKQMTDINKLFFGTEDGGNPLPVELVSFSAQRKGTHILLNWSTATEVNNYGFEIEKRSEKSEEWIKAGFVPGNGNSNSTKDYSFTDPVTVKGKLFYRLKQIDTDGAFSYSDPVSISSGAPENFTLRQNYPNPFNPSTTISYSIPEDSYTKLIVYDALGREVRNLVNSEQMAGDYEINFDGDGLPSGLYICRLYSKDYSSTIQMLLIK